MSEGKIGTFVANDEKKDKHQNFYRLPVYDNYLFIESFSSYNLLMHLQIEYSTIVIIHTCYIDSNLFLISS